MRNSDQPKKAPVLRLRFLIVILILVTLYALQMLNDAGKRHEQIAAMTVAQPSVLKKVQLGDKTVSIPSYALFETGNVWALVSRERTLQEEADYRLVDIQVAHGDADQPMRIASVISEPLQRLVNAAEADGESLMISSAYRSLDEQRRIRDSFVKKQGEAMAELYVLPVGASEHHTGLAVDFSSTSDDCAEDSDTCSLGQSSAAGLEKNASRFGFILRYPQGKQPITGVGYEPWHYRYVGRPMAEAMAATDLTFEEVIQQIAPGYAKN